MCHIPKQSHYLRRPALDMLCNSLCGPRTKKFEASGLRYSLRHIGKGVVLGLKPRLELDILQKLYYKASV